MDRQNNQDEIDILTRTATQPLCFASQARMHSGRASGSHPSANVDMPYRPRSTSIDVPGPQILDAVREPSTHFGGNILSYDTHHVIIIGLSYPKGVLVIAYHIIFYLLILYIFFSLFFIYINTNSLHQDRQCPSKSTYNRGLVHFWFSSIRNRVGDKVVGSSGNSSLSSTLGRCTAWTKVALSPVCKCLKTCLTSKSFAVEVTAPSAGSSKQWVRSFYYIFF